MPRDIVVAAQDACKAHTFPGCAIGLIRRGRETELVGVGSQSYDANARVVTADTQYDVASITKSIPTASLALVLIKEGKLRLTDTVGTHLPDFQNDHGATVRDLLTYTVSGARMSELRNLSADGIRTHVFSVGFDGPPHEPKYTNLPAYVLGIIIEKVTQTTLDILARRYFFDPLHMSNTAWYAGATFARAAPTEMDDWRGLVVGVTHDESAYTLAKGGRIAGHAGIFSTAQDLSLFLRPLIERADDASKCIVEGAQQGYGWHIHDTEWMGTQSNALTFGKTGFTGTSVLVDVERGLGLVILSNRTYPKRPVDSTAIYRFRQMVADMAFESLDS